MTVANTLQQLIMEFRKAGIDTPELDAEVLLADILGIERYRLITDPGRTLTGEEEEMTGRAGERRLRGEPVAYITGMKEFYSLPFHVDPRVLIPRPETEILVDLAVYHAGGNARVLDVGTGSGAIAVALKYSRRDCSVFASDISEGALEVARKNAKEILGEGMIDFRRGDLFMPFGKMGFDLVLANPPYIDPDQEGSLPMELFYEPREALFGGNGGMDIILRIMRQGHSFLNRNGCILMEIGDGQEGPVSEMARNLGYVYSVVRDYAGVPRVVILMQEC